MSLVPHILLVAYPLQGHINPARHLALRLLHATGANVTVSTAVSAHCRMFPAVGGDDALELDHVDSAGVRYVPYSDESGPPAPTLELDHTDYIARLRLVGPRALTGVLARLRDAGRPVTRVVYTVLLSWVAGVARNHGLPAVVYWIQSATALASYFHVLRGTDGLDKAIAAATGDLMAAVNVPGLPSPLLMRDLPSFLLDDGDGPYAVLLTAFRELFHTLLLDGHSTVLANTLGAMEPEAVVTLRQHGLDVVPIGPVLSFLDPAAMSSSLDDKNKDDDLFKQDGKEYLAWLDERPSRSVVYISFGSMSVMSKRQIVEVERGMALSGRPFLWVLRKDNPRGGGRGGGGRGGDGDTGLVVEWCNQGKVLSHPAVGCFVTHCGWNSTLESVACGVPLVGVPQWTDQGTNAWLMEQIGTGIRAAVAMEDGVLEAEELRRCIALATSEMLRAEAQLWRDKARAAVLQGGSSDLNLRAALFSSSSASSSTTPPAGLLKSPS